MREDIFHLPRKFDHDHGIPHAATKAPISDASDYDRVISITEKRFKSLRLPEAKNCLKLSQRRPPWDADMLAGVSWSYDSWKAFNTRKEGETRAAPSQRRNHLLVEAVSRVTTRTDSMKKQYRRRRTDSSDSEHDRGGDKKAADSGSPPIKVLRHHRDDDSLRSSRRDDSKTYSSSGAANRERDRYGDRSRRDEEERRRRGGREGNARGYGGRDGGASYYSSFVAGGRGDRDRERERGRDRGRDLERDPMRDRDARVGGGGRGGRHSETFLGTDRFDSRLERDRDGRRDSRGRPDYAPRERERGNERERGKEREKERERAREKERENEREKGRDRGRDRDGEREPAVGVDRVGGARREEDPVRSSAKDAASSKSKGIFSYIAPTGGGSGRSAANGETNGNAPVSPARPERNGDGALAGAGAGPARAARPNSTALSNILRSDRRTNHRLDREQFDGAQTRLRRLAPEGNEVKDTFRCARLSTICREQRR